MFGNHDPEISDLTSIKLCNLIKPNNNNQTNFLLSFKKPSAEKELPFNVLHY